ECLSFPAPQETGSALSAENAQTINYTVSLLQKTAFVNENVSIDYLIIRHLLLALVEYECTEKSVSRA
ncbi:MAG: hypothetical protein K1W21_03880, partial [Oscillospiraceae bacterium]